MSLISYSQEHQFELNINITRFNLNSQKTQVWSPIKFNFKLPIISVWIPNITYWNLVSQEQKFGFRLPTTWLQGQTSVILRVVVQNPNNSLKLAYAAGPVFSVECDSFEIKMSFRTLYLMLTVLSKRRRLQLFGRVRSVKPSEDDIITSLPVALSGPLPGCRALYYGSHCSSGQKQKSWTPVVFEHNPNKLFEMLHLN